MPPKPNIPGTGVQKPTTPQIRPPSADRTAPKCFGTDYFGKWNTTGMTFESMRVDKPEYQQKCANCDFFQECYLVNHIRILRIKR